MSNPTNQRSTRQKSCNPVQPIPAYLWILGEPPRHSNTEGGPKSPKVDLEDSRNPHNDKRNGFWRILLISEYCQWGKACHDAEGENQDSDEAINWKDSVKDEV